MRNVWGSRLVTLEARRTRADIIEVFKIMKGLEGLNREDFFEMEVDKRTRGHTLKILKRGARLDCRKYSFSQRVVNIWNALPAEAVSCTTVNSFKGKIAPLIQHIGGSYISHRLSDPVSLRPATWRDIDAGQVFSMSNSRVTFCPQCIARLGNQAEG